MNARATALLVLIAAVACVAQTMTPADYQIQNLPGLSGNASFAQYSGYVDVEGYGQYFFWFVESQNDPSTDPTVLWLNGGPGCSSLGGFLGENGPWWPNAENQLVDNPYSWNRIANMLYLESPAGVGFSIQQSVGFERWNDDLTSTASYDFLKNWFATFETFQESDFYITGESYAGHYIPTLVDKIYEGNKDSSNLPINLKGFMVGNPATDNAYDSGELYEEYFWSHGLNCLDHTQNSGKGGVYNPYDILADVCYGLRVADHVRFPNPTADALRGLMKEQDERRARLGARDVPEMPPCISDTTANYLNQPSVQEAIHAAPTEWQDCGGIMYQHGQESMIPFYQKFLTETNYRMMVYSGDADTVLPFIGTEQWVLDLGLTPTELWGPWYSDWNGQGPQVAGYYVNYGQMQYATVKGAGHEVPWFQPGSAYDMFERYLTNTQLHGTYH